MFVLRRSNRSQTPRPAITGASKNAKLKSQSGELDAADHLDLCIMSNSACNSDYGWSKVGPCGTVACHSCHNISLTG